MYVAWELRGKTVKSFTLLHMYALRPLLSLQWVQKCMSQHRKVDYKCFFFIHNLQCSIKYPAKWMYSIAYVGGRTLAFWIITSNRVSNAPALTQPANTLASFSKRILTKPSWLACSCLCRPWTRQNQAAGIPCIQNSILTRTHHHWLTYRAVVHW